MTMTAKEQYALVSGRLDRHGGLKEVSFVPGDFSGATFWPAKATAKTVFAHFKARPGQPCRVPGTLAKSMFGFTDRELWHEPAPKRSAKK